VEDAGIWRASWAIAPPFVNLGFLNRCVQEMVKLSPLQNYVFEVVSKSDEAAVIGAAITRCARDRVIASLVES
jgi:hypothetical protein